jgi:hypothetical protein
MMDWSIVKREWKFDDPEATKVIAKNVADYDRMRMILPRRCKVPDCGYVIAALTGQDIFELPDFGPVCGVCYHMHAALQAPGLKNIYYFRWAHDAWKRSQNEGRGRMGLS